MTILQSFFRRAVRTEPNDAHHDPGDARDQLLVPIVRLPHKFFLGVLIPGTSPRNCSRCGWSGDPRTLLNSSSQIVIEIEKNHNHTPHPQRKRTSRLSLLPNKVSKRYQRLTRSDCASCQVLTLISKRVVTRSGDLHGSFATASTTAYPKGHLKIIITTTQTDPSCTISSWWHLFSPIDRPQSLLNSYFNIPSRHWTGVDVVSERSVQFAKDCVETCLQSHKICRSGSDESFLPTRMICVDAYQTDMDVRLESKSWIPPGSRYIALSYCWGNYHPVCMTKSSNLQSQMNRISWKAMPATFQDAVRFTRSLGVRYLWIDSMCIIQQDEADWASEATTMYEVYKNSYVTLAALDGDDSQAGLCKDSNKSQSTALAILSLGKSYVPLFTRLPHFLDDTNPAQIVLGHWYWEGSCPLLARAWAFQERMVSPRVLYFTKNEIVFQCFCAANCECGATTGANPLHIWKLSPQGFRNMEDSRGLIWLPEGGSATHKSIDYAWRRVIVPGYSILDLSEPRDRLPALGAVAHQFQVIRHDEKYVAGLWSATLHKDLLWTCRYLPKSLDQKAALNRPYSLPTWSWASLPVPVGYDSEVDNVNTMVAEIIQASCVYAGGDHSGILQGSILILRSGALRCLADWERSTDEHIQWWKLSYFWEGTWTKTELPGNWASMCCMDHDGSGYQSLVEQEELYVFEIAKSVSGSRGYLLLREEDQKNSIYTRAGVVWFKTTFEWYNNGNNGNLNGVVDHFEEVFDKHSVVKQCEIR